MTKLIFCNACVVPNSRANIYLNDKGVCNACVNHKKKIKIDWKSRLKELKSLIIKTKKKSRIFDCLVPVSGGKDSTWQVHKCLKLGLKPLALTYKTPGRNKIGDQNLKNLIALGVDHIDWTVNPKVEAKFTLETFKKKGATAIPMHFAIHNISQIVAKNFNIPLIVWGDNPADEFGYSDPKHSGPKILSNWRKSFGTTNGTSINDWVGAKLTKKDFSSYNIEKASRNKILEVFLGYYIKWDPKKVFEYSKKIGFKKLTTSKTGYYNFADIDCDFISIHHWLKWYKFGFNRNFDNLSVEIRNGRMTRKKAIKIISQNQNFLPKKDIEKFCKFTNISIKEFFRIAETFRNKKIWKKKKGVWAIENFLIQNWKWN